MAGKKMGRASAALHCVALIALFGVASSAFPRLFVTLTQGNDILFYTFKGSSFPSDPVLQVNPSMFARGWGQHPNSMIYMYECKNDTTAYNCIMQKMDSYYKDMITYQADERAPPTPRYATCWNPFVFGFRFVENLQKPDNHCEQPTITLTGDKGLSLPRFACPNDTVVHYCVAGGQRGDTCTGYSTSEGLFERCYANSGTLGLSSHSEIREALSAFIRTDRNRNGNHSYFALDESSGSVKLSRYAFKDMERREIVNVGPGQAFSRMGYWYERQADYIMWLVFDADAYSSTLHVYNTLTNSLSSSSRLKGKPMEFIVGGEYVLP